MPRDTNLSLDDIAARSEQDWIVWGPNSGGVIKVFYGGGVVYTYYGGDARSEGSSGLTEETAEEYVRAGSGDAEVLAWLRAKGHV